MATIPLVYPFVAPVPKLEAQMWWGRHPHRKQTHDRGGGRTGPQHSCATGMWKCSHLNRMPSTERV